MAVRIDLTGRGFGKLRVLREGEKNRHGQLRWVCECDCGRTVTVLGQLLRNGGTRSCGCILKERFVDITGQRFGQFKALYRSTKKHGRTAWWVCKCDCGRTVTVDGTALRKGKTKSCHGVGPPVVDLAGKKIGQINVLRRCRKKGRQASWVCKCDCGRTVTIRGDCLRKGQKSCGCLLGAHRLFDITGQRFGKLTVKGRATKKRHWVCRCDCGRVVTVRGDALQRGNTKSCGCLAKNVRPLTQPPPLNGQVPDNTDSPIPTPKKPGRGRPRGKLDEDVQTRNDRIRQKWRSEKYSSKAEIAREENLEAALVRVILAGE